jgi:uncharacterized protein YjaG (DUF416 family)
MDFGGLFKKNEKQESLTILIDIGGTSVGGAIVRNELGKAPHVIYSYREKIPPIHSISFERLLGSTLKTLRNVAHTIEKDGFRHLNFTGDKSAGNYSVCCTLSSPWEKTIVKNILIEKAEPFIVGDQYVASLVDAELEKFKSTLADEVSIALYGKNPTIIENTIVRALVNGYSVSKIIDSKVNRISLTAVFSLSPSLITKAVEGILHKRFRYDSIRWSSFMLASFLTLRDHFPLKDDFILLQIGGDITEIYIVKKDTIIQSISFPFGYNFLYKKAKERYEDISPEIIRSHLGIRAHDTEQPIGGTELDKILEQAEKDWLTLFYSSLKDTSEEMFMPKDIFLSADADIAEIFASFIERSTFSQYGVAHGIFAVTTIQDKTLSHAVTVKEGITPDPSLLLEAVYTHTVRYAKPTGGVVAERKIQRYDIVK